MCLRRHPFTATALLALAAVSSARGASIDATLQPLGGTSWRADYTVSNALADVSVRQFTVYFDVEAFANLAVAAAPADWDALVIQPDPLLPDRGFFDALAMGSGLAPATSLGGFAVTFDYTLPGEPPTQAFEFLNPDTLEVLASGDTVVSQVPAPASVWLLLSGVTAALLRQRRRGRQGCRKARPTPSDGEPVTRADRYGQCLGLGLTALVFASAYGTSAAAEDLTGSMTFDRLELVSSVRSGRTTIDYAYKVRVRNSAGLVSDVVANVTGGGSGLTVIDGAATFGLVRHSTALSDDRVVLRQDRSFPFDPGALTWTFSGVRAAPVGSGVRILAGKPGGGGFSDSTGSLSRLPFDADPINPIAVDRFGTTYVGHFDWGVIRAIRPNGEVRTIGAPNEGILDRPRDGDVSQARFFSVNGLAVRSDGALLVGDSASVRLVSPDGQVSTLAGSTNQQGSSDGVGSAARFGLIQDVLLNRTETILYIADILNHTVRALELGTGRVTTIAGASGFAGNVDGIGGQARFNQPRDLALTPNGDILVQESLPGGGTSIRRVSPAGVVTTLPALGLTSVSEIEVDAGGTLYFHALAPDLARTFIYQRTPAGTVSPIAGFGGEPVLKDGGRATASFSFSLGSMALGPGGSLFVLDAGVVREVARDGSVTSIAGAPPAVYRTPSSDLPPCLGLAGNYSGESLAFESLGSRGAEATFGNFNIRIAPNGSFTFNAAFDCLSALPFPRRAPSGFRLFSISAAGAVKQVMPNPLPPAQVLPNQQLVDSQGSLYWIEYLNSSTSPTAIRKVRPDGSSFILAGGSSQNSGILDGPGATARFERIDNMVIDAGDNIFLIDKGSWIRKVTPDGVVTTIAGRFAVGAGLDGVGANARFDTAADLAVDSRGDLWVVERRGCAIRRVTAAGVVSTPIGAPLGLTFETTLSKCSYADGIGTAARFKNPEAIAIDSRDTLYVADTGNGVIRRVTLDGVVTTAVGSVRPVSTSVFGFPSGPFRSDAVLRLGEPSVARLNRPVGVAVIDDRHLAIADSAELVVLIATLP